MGRLSKCLKACWRVCALLVPVLLWMPATQAQSQPHSRTKAEAQVQTQAQTQAFDPPLRHHVINLGRSPYGHMRLTCDYFAGFMVKQLDLGEEGADWFAIVPSPAAHPPLCTRTHSAAEKVISGKDWCGYFQGAKKNFVFFNACNAYNGGLDFAVYDARTGTRIFQDTAVDSSAGGLHFARASGDGVAVRYSRIEIFKCTLPREGEACWSQIQGKLGLKNASLPECTSYEKQMTGSVIAYPVEVSLSLTPKVQPLAGEIRCWPPE